jgi:hypothetical protein
VRLRTSIPVYVTRENPDGLVGSWFVTGWMAMVVLYVVALNVIGWGIYGLVTLAQKVVG